MFLALIKYIPFITIGIFSFLLLVRYPIVGLFGMVILLPIQEITSFLNGRTLVWALGVFTFYAWLIKSLIWHKKIRLNRDSTFFVFLFIAWCILSSLWATNQAEAVSRSIILLQAMAFFILLQDLIANINYLKALIFSYFISVSICGLVSIFWGVNYQSSQRISISQMQNPAHFAEILGIGLLFSLYIFNWSKKKMWKILVATCIFILSIAIILTGTRTVWVALIITLLTDLFIFKSFVKVKSFVFTSVIGSVAFVMLIHFNIISSYFVNRIVTLLNLNATHGGAGRMNIWLVGWEMIKARPIIGVGIGNFPVRFANYIDKAYLLWRGYGVYAGRDPHSIYLSIQSELGIIGTTLFVAFIISILRPLLSCRKRRECTLSFLLMIFILISGITITIQYRKYFWLSIGLATLVPMVIHNERN